MRLRRFSYHGQDVLVSLLRPGEAVCRAWLRQVKADIGSDGCSGVPDFYLDCCIVHDLAYRFAVDPWGRPTSRAEADAAFRACIQRQSRLGKASPMAWVRWLGVRAFGSKAWNAHRTAQEGPGDASQPPVGLDSRQGL
mgnify:CR=1 FL=1